MHLIRIGIIFDILHIQSGPMKRLLLLFSLFLGLTSQAQLVRGTKIAGLQTNLIVGDIYATSLTLDVGSYSSEYGFNLVPTFGWVLMENWVVGGQANFGILREKTPLIGANMDGISTYYDLGLAPFTRFYLDITKNKKWKAFGMASIELATVKSRYSIKGNSNPGPVSTTSNSDLKGGLGVGFAYFGKSTSIDLNAGLTGLRFGIYRVIKPGKK